MTSAEEPITAVEENDQTIVPTRLPEQAQVLKLRMFSQVSFSSLIYQWQPMGFRIRVDIPFISDDSGLLFIVRNGPYIPPWHIVYPHIATKDLLFHWNNTRPVFHHRDGGGLDLPAIEAKPPLIRKGIEVTQHDLPPILATMASSFRKWRGDMQYRFRVVAGFATQGYLVTMPIKNAHIPIGIYDEYSRCPPLLRLDSSYREGMINSYVPSDTSMFRHTEITMPYEYPMPWYDQYHWLEQRSEVSQALMEGTFNTKLVIEPCGDNYVGLGFRGAIESQKDKSFIMIELEYRAMEGFQFADPGVPPYHMMQSLTELRYTNWDQATQWRKIKTVPSDAWESDGISTIKKKGYQRPISLEERFQLMVGVGSSSTPEPIQDHGSQPSIPTSTIKPLYSECRYDSKTKTTYCKTLEGEWKHWPGDQRTRLQNSSLIVRKPREVDSSDGPLPLSERGEDFMY